MSFKRAPTNTHHFPLVFACKEVGFYLTYEISTNNFSALEFHSNWFVCFFPLLEHCRFGQAVIELFQYGFNHSKRDHSINKFAIIYVLVRLSSFNWRNENDVTIYDISIKINSNESNLDTFTDAALKHFICIFEIVSRFKQKVNMQ